MLKDEIKYVFQNISHRKMRSFLSVLSILIGVASIFALLSFGIGIQHYVDTLAAQSGTDKLFVQAAGIGAPGTDLTFFLSKEDIDFISKINNVQEAVGIYTKPAEIAFKKEKKFNYMAAIDIAHQQLIIESFAVKIDKGRDLKSGDAGKVVLGYNYQTDNKIFKKGLKIGDSVDINGVPHQVVGFYQAIGNPSDDGNIYVIKEDFEKMHPDIVDKFGFVMIRANKGVSPTELAANIKEKLRKHKGEQKGHEDFYVQSFEDAIATFSSIILIINGVLVLIAIVSMIVAFVNIMNTMYTAVLERTKEIGIMKSIGARNSYIMFIFVLEAGIIGMMGGIAGVILGFIVAKIGESAAAASGFSLLQANFPVWLFIGCLLFATIVGMASGYLPARQASRMKPVDALRYE